MKGWGLVSIDGSVNGVWGRLGSYLEAHGYNASPEKVYASGEELPQKTLPCWVDESVSQDLLKSYPRADASVLHLGTCDVLLPRLGSDLWPRCLLQDVLPQILLSSDLQLPLQSAALVVGEGPWSLAAAVACSRAGYARISLLDQGSGRIGVGAIQLQKLLMGVQISILSLEQITSLGSEYGLVVDVLGAESAQEAYDQMVYFNYLVRGGVVVDCGLHGSVSPLVAETGVLGLQGVGSEILWRAMAGAFAESQISKTP